MSTMPEGGAAPQENQIRAVKKCSRNQRFEPNPRGHDITLSKALSYVLRHAAPSLGLEISSDGYVPVDDVLSLNHPKFRDRQSGRQRYSVDDVIRVVEVNDKQRFKLEYKPAPDDDNVNEPHIEDTSQSTDTERTTTSITNKRVLCIRANQGHSFNAGLQSNQLLTPLTAEELSNPDQMIIHGTTRRAWEDHIRIEGLRRMKRNHIHFATGLPNNREKSPISGMRSSSEIYIYVSGKKCAEDEIPFYTSANGVILSAGVEEKGLLPLKYFDKVVHASSGKVLWDNEL
jgi:2'-phosphotransferase